MPGKGAMGLGTSDSAAFFLCTRKEMETVIKDDIAKVFQVWNVL